MIFESLFPKGQRIPELYRENHAVWFSESQDTFHTRTKHPTEGCVSYREAQLRSLCLGWTNGPKIKNDQSIYFFALNLIFKMKPKKFIPKPFWTHI